MMMNDKTTWVPLLKQPHLPHQLDLKFALAKTHTQGVCNCGWTSTLVKPDDPKGFPFVRVQYEGHLLAEGVITVEQTRHVYEEQLAWSWPV